MLVYSLVLTLIRYLCFLVSGWNIIILCTPNMNVFSFLFLLAFLNNLSNNLVISEHYTKHFIHWILRLCLCQCKWNCVRIFVSRSSILSGNRKDKCFTSGRYQIWVETKSDYSKHFSPLKVWHELNVRKNFHFLFDENLKILEKSHDFSP